MVHELDRGTYRLLSHGSRSVPHNPLLLYFDNTPRVELRLLISGRIRIVGLHVGSSSSELRSWLSPLFSFNASVAPVVWWLPSNTTR